MYLLRLTWHSIISQNPSVSKLVQNRIYAIAQLVFEVICPLDDSSFFSGAPLEECDLETTERFWHFNFLLTKKEFSHYVLTFCFLRFYCCTQIKNEDLMGLLNCLTKSLKNGSVIKTRRMNHNWYQMEKVGHWEVWHGDIPRVLLSKKL